jgi:NAD(P)-dependent dehydrogenase (short-subunit alcohol dehydrogenase family)
MYCIDFSGRVAIVTGACREMGRQIVVTLAGVGLHVIANSRLFPESVKDLIDDTTRLCFPNTVTSEESFSEQWDI